ncbi:MAG TPA: hypothetical protein VIZ43_13180 [Trebonia sp.]
MGGSGPDDQRGDEAPGGAAAGVTTDDRVAAAVEALYGADPEVFTGRRGELAATARGAGDREAARAIAALRRPTRAAWVVNRLTRTDPSAPPKLAELAAALRAAQQARSGPRLRELSAARGALVDLLTAQALGAAGLPDPPASLRLEVAETLTAAVADPDVAAEFAAGTLTRAVQWAGFGPPIPAGEPDADPDDTEPAADDTDTGRPGGTAASGAGGARGTAAGGKARRGGGERPHGGGRAPDPVAGVPAQTPPGAAERRRVDAEELLAQEAAERAARRREQDAEAERVVAAATVAATAAVSAEDRLEAEVRDLERRVTQARGDLAAARMRARHAEAAERRARQALDRLRRE